MSKPRVVKDYEKLPETVQEQIKLVYPLGFLQHLVKFVNKEGETRMGLPFETEEYYYLIRMSKQAAQDIVDNDDDFDDDGNLKQKVKDKYMDKYEDLDYLDLNANEDNDLEEDVDELDDF